MGAERRIALGALLLLTFVLFLSGCGSAGNHTEGEVCVLVDCLGREVEVPAKIEKIAAIDSFSGEALIMIGAGEKMAACPNGVKGDKLLETIYPELPKVAVVQSEGAINAEALLELSVDVVLLKNSFYLSEGETAKLDKLGIPYLVIQYETMEEQLEALALVGQVAGGAAEEKAEALCDYYRNTIDLVRDRSALIPAEERLTAYHSISEAVRTDGTDSLGADWISAVGCKNVSVGEPLTPEGENYYASLEQIFNWNPDVILCNDKATAEYICSSMKWKGLSAVREGKVYNIPVGATRWGQQGSVETYFGMLWAGTVLYPEYYGDIDLKTEVKKVYQDILGLEVDDALYQKILSGEGIRQGSSSSGK